MRRGLHLIQLYQPLDFYSQQDFYKLPKFKVDIRDIQTGYPNAQVVFSDEKKQDKGFIYLTEPNGFVAEVKAEEIFKQNKKKYLSIIKKLNRA